MLQRIDRNTIAYLKRHTLSKLDKEYRKKVISILEKGDSKSIQKFLNELLTSRDSSLVGTAIMIAEKIFPNNSEEIRFNILKQLKHNNSWVRQRAADSMKVLGNREAVPQLLEALNDRNTLVRTYLCEALEKIGDKRCIPYIGGLCGDKSDLVRQAALETLARFPDQLELDHILSFLNDKSALVRLAAIYALNEKYKLDKNTRQKILASVSSHLKKEKDGLVRCDIFEMLYRCTSNQDMLKKLLDLAQSKRGVVRWRVYDTMAMVANRSNAFSILEVLKSKLREEKHKGIRKHIRETVKQINKKIVR